MITTTVIQILLSGLQQAADASGKVRSSLEELLTTTPALEGSAGRRIRLWFEILGQEALSGREVRERWLILGQESGMSDLVLERLQADFNRSRSGTKPCDELLMLARDDLRGAARAAQIGQPVEQQLDDLIVRFTKESANANAVRQELIEHSAQRIEILSRKMLRRSFPKVRTIAQTGDVVVGAVMRLMRALRSVSPLDPRAFFGLAGLQIRRELIDLARQLKRDRQRDDPNTSHEPELGSGDNPRNLECWSRFHEAVERLSPEQKEVVDLHWYQGLTLEEIADVVGVDKSTSKRRWRAARDWLADELHDCATVMLEV